MSLKRELEPEVMDSSEEAEDYNAMDHSQVNQVFVQDMLAFAKAHGKSLEDVLDLGTGTALIPVELCQQDANCRVMAIDMAVHMLDLARYNIEAAGLIERVQLAQVDAKQMPFSDAMFSTVMSNSIIHHIPDPADCVSEMVRVTCRGGLLFIRDLLRPDTEEEVAKLVETYAGQENAHSRQMFDDSLRAALSIDEIRELVVHNGFPAETVQATTDRHWTWAVVKS